MFAQQPHLFLNLILRQWLLILVFVRRDAFVRLELVQRAVSQLEESNFINEHIKRHVGRPP